MFETVSYDNCHSFFIQKYKKLNFGKVSIFKNIYSRYKLKIKVLELSKD